MKLHSLPFIRALEKKFSLTSIPGTAVFLLHDVSFSSFGQYIITEADSFSLLLSATKILRAQTVNLPFHKCMH